MDITLILSIIVFGYLGVFNVMEVVYFFLEQYGVKDEVL